MPTVLIWVAQPYGKKLIRADNAVVSSTGTLAVARTNKTWKLTFVPLGLALGAYFGHFKHRNHAAAFMRDLDRLWGTNPDIQEDYIGQQAIAAWNVTCNKHNLPRITPTLLTRLNIKTNWKGR